MPITLNEIFNLNEDEIKNSKIELNMKAGKDGESFLDRWLRRSDAEKKTGYGTNWDCSFWGWYGKSRPNFRKGNWVFSFARFSANEWLFLSAAKIIEVPKNAWAKVEILNQFSPFFGRLIIQCNKGNTFNLYTFKLSKYIDKCSVLEILPDIYEGDQFPGYNKVHLSWNKLEYIFNRKKPDWLNALSQQKGVYLITDNKTGKLYVGSASGNQDGLWQRWEKYVKNGHGGNKELEKLDFNYIKKNFSYSILENYNFNTSREVIVERENWWKEILSTTEHGYNKN